jgi:signal transduction histidine kinase
VKQSTVLIISDNAAFPSAVTARWQQERSLPSFTLMGSDVCHELDPDAFDLAIVGEVNFGARALLEKSLEAAKKPAILIIAQEETTHSQAGPWTKVLRKARTAEKAGKNNDDGDGWLDVLVLVAAEMLLHAKTASAARRLEQQNTLLERHAALGNYMLEVRHNLNNALTSILGNSELILLDGDQFPGSLHSQVETIRNMAIRINEILQRFSSLEKELMVAGKQNERKTAVKSRTLAAGA